MKMILKPKQAGKTASLIRWLANAEEGEYRVLISPTIEGSRLAYYDAVDMGFEVESRQFLPASEAQHALKDKDAVVAIDDLDACLYVLLGSEVEIITQSSRV